MKKIIIHAAMIFFVSSAVMAEELIYSTTIEGIDPAGVEKDPQTGDLTIIEKPYWFGIRVVRDGHTCTTTIQDNNGYEILEVEGIELIKRDTTAREFSVDCRAYLSKTDREDLANSTLADNDA